MSSATLNWQRLISSAITAIIFFFALAITAPTIAVADDSQARAEQLFNEGRQLLRDGEHLRAATKFEDAYDILGVPPLLYNIGEAYRRGDELAKAEEYYQKYLAEATDPPNEDDVVEMIIEIQQRLAAKMATVTVTSVPEGAAIYVDDAPESQCQTPCEIDLAPGEYALRSALDGYDDARVQIQLEARDEIETSISLTPETTYGRIYVRTDVDDATLHVGGNNYRLPRSQHVELETGRHLVAIEWKGDRWKHDIELGADEELHLFIPVDAGGDTFSPLHASAIGLGGASAALAAAAVLTGLQARSTHESLLTQQSEHGTVNHDLVQTGERQRTMTNGLWLGAFVTFGTGAGLWAWEMFGSRSESQESERLEPTPDNNEHNSDDDPGVDLL